MDMSLTLIVQADEEMAAGRFREAGRLALEAADAIQTPDDAERVAELAMACMEQCQFVQRGRFELVPDPSRGSFRISEVLAALSHALDLTEGQPAGHAARSCVLGVRIADQIGLAEEDRNALFYALLLKDAGCSSSAARMSTLFGVDDLVLKADGKRVDWSRPGEVLRFVTRHAGEGGSPLRRVARVGSVASRLKREGHAIVETRCERGAGVVRQLDLP